MFHVTVWVVCLQFAQLLSTWELNMKWNCFGHHQIRHATKCQITKQTQVTPTSRNVASIFNHLKNIIYFLLTFLEQSEKSYSQLPKKSASYLRWKTVEAVTNLFLSLLAQTFISFFFFSSCEFFVFVTVTTRMYPHPHTFLFFFRSLRARICALPCCVVTSLLQSPWRTSRGEDTSSQQAFRSFLHSFRDMPGANRWASMFLFACKPPYLGLTHPIRTTQKARRRALCSCPLLPPAFAKLYGARFRLRRAAWLNSCVVARHQMRDKLIYIRASIAPPRSLFARARTLRVLSSVRLLSLPLTSRASRRQGPEAKTRSVLHFA